ncbi:hypothetical protein EV363DRAFT_1160016, partial [Boletus edulis]
ESRRLETRSLAEDKTSASGTNVRRRTIPTPSKPSFTYPRTPADYVDPPCRRGRLKTRPRKVSHTSKYTDHVEAKPGIPELSE